MTTQISGKFSKIITSFDDNRDELRKQARENIARIQHENKTGYNRNKKVPTRYNERDLVATKRTQQGPGLKFCCKYLGPYEVIKALRNHRYVLRKVGEHEGPLQTSSAADCMKLWLKNDEDDGMLEVDEEEGTDEHSGRMLVQDGRV